ncbi:MAG: hypothetical protein AB7N91_12310 [Candidatus Tectimicrobiota bacterium]
MAHAHFPDIVHEVQRLLDRRGRDYLPLRQITASLPARLRQELGLTRSLPAAELLKKLTPLLREPLQVYRHGTSISIGLHASLETLLVRRLQRSPRLSPKQLGVGLPMSKKDYIAALNTLLEAGTLICTFKENHTPVLQLAATAAPEQPAPDTEAEARRTFYAAYQTVGQGRSFVRIHRLREALPWPRERFDRLLRALLADYSVELHGGDPSLMTAEDLRQSYTAADGTLYIALSWRGNT